MHRLAVRRGRPGAVDGAETLNTETESVYGNNRGATSGHATCRQLNNGVRNHLYRSAARDHDHER